MFKTPKLLETLKTINDKRYISDFEEIRKIGSGGFSSVFEVKNKLDDNYYAVKKIQLKIKNHKKDINSELERVLREAKFLAKVFHQNIIRYYNCWIELKMYENFDSMKQANPIIEPITTDNRQTFTNEPITPTLKNDEESEFFLEIDSNTHSELFFDDNDSPRDVPIFDVKKKEKENIQHPQPQKNPILKHLEKKALNPKMDVFTPPPKSPQTEETDNIKSILIYIQSELCEETLEQYLENRNKLFFQLPIVERSILNDPFFKEIYIILDQILSALTYIHKNCQLVHRDLKPSNIFLNKGLKVKIGDFGLVKKLENLAPLEPPPFFITPSISQEGSPQIKPDLELSYGKIGEEINFWRNRAQTPNIEIENQLSHSNENFMVNSFKTRSCGTKTYASPEQMAINCVFDYRADIYSLGIIMLQLFHPMKTVMEFNKIIGNSKKKNLPTDLVRELPEIVGLINKMIDENPDRRPTLKNIVDSLKNMASKFLPNPPDLLNLGKFYFKKENSDKFDIKVLKLIKQHLYCFANENDLKAENVYNLNECNLNLSNNNGKNMISIEHNIQFNCFIYASEGEDNTLKCFQEIQKTLINVP